MRKWGAGSGLRGSRHRREDDYGEAVPAPIGRRERRRGLGLRTFALRFQPARIVADHARYRTARLAAGRFGHHTLLLVIVANCNIPDQREVLPERSADKTGTAATAGDRMRDR